MPELPATIAASVGRYTEFRTASLADWHPQRREMLITTRFADTNQVHEVKFPGGARKQLTFFPDRVSGVSFAPGRGDFFLFGKDKGGDEFSQLYRFDVASGDVTLLTDGGRSRTAARPGARRRPRCLQHHAPQRQGPDIHLMDPSDPGSDRMLQVEGGGWSPRLEARRQVDPRVEWVSITRATSGWWTPRPARKDAGSRRRAAAKVSYAGGGSTGTARPSTSPPTRTPSSIAWLASSWPGAPTPSSRTHDQLGRGQLRVLPDGNTIAFVTNEEGVGVLHLLDTATGQERPAHRLGPASGVIGTLTGTRTARPRLHVLLGALALDVYSLDATTGKVERWTESETGGLNTAASPSRSWSAGRASTAGRSRDFCTAPRRGSPASGR